MHVNPFSGMLASMPPPGGSQSGQSGSPLLSMLPIVLMVVIIYFLMFRPQQQRAKLQAKLLANLKAGDRVVTSAGIIGVVVNVKDNTVTIRSGDAKFEVTKASVTDLIKDDASTTTVS